jgi:hypothetical protein
VTTESQTIPASVGQPSRPTWLKVVQAVLLGFVLGLVLHAGLSVLLVKLGAATPGGSSSTAPAVQCKKQNPARQLPGPKSSASIWRADGFNARFV